MQDETELSRFVANAFQASQQEAPERQQRQADLREFADRSVSYVADHLVAMVTGIAGPAEYRPDPQDFGSPTRRRFEVEATITNQGTVFVEVSVDLRTKREGDGQMTYDLAANVRSMLHTELASSWQPVRTVTSPEGLIVDEGSLKEKVRQQITELLGRAAEG